MFYGSNKRGQTKSLIILGLGSVILDLFHFQSVQATMHFCSHRESHSSISLWMTRLLCYLPAALCNIEQSLYKLVLQNLWRTHRIFGSIVAVGVMQQLPRLKTGDLWAREEGAAGESRGAKIIREMKLLGLSQQGFLPI